MKVFKKIVISALLITLVFAMVGCGNGSARTLSNSNSQKTTTGIMSEAEQRAIFDQFSFNAEERGDTVNIRKFENLDYKREGNDDNIQDEHYVTDPVGFSIKVPRDPYDIMDEGENIYYEVGPNVTYTSGKAACTQVYFGYSLYAIYDNFYDLCTTSALSEWG